MTLPLKNSFFKGMDSSLVQQCCHLLCGQDVPLAAVLLRWQRVAQGENSCLGMYGLTQEKLGHLQTATHSLVKALSTSKAPICHLVFPPVHLHCNTWQCNVTYPIVGWLLPVVEKKPVQAGLRTRQCSCGRKGCLLTCPFLLHKIPFLSGLSAVRPHYFSRSLAICFMIDFLY